MNSLFFSFFFVILLSSLDFCEVRSYYNHSMDILPSRLGFLDSFIREFILASALIIYLNAAAQCWTVGCMVFVEHLQPLHGGLPQPHQIAADPSAWQPGISEQASLAPSVVRNQYYTSFPSMELTYMEWVSLYMKFPFHSLGRRYLREADYYEKCLLELERQHQKHVKSYLRRSSEDFDGGCLGFCGRKNRKLKCETNPTTTVVNWEQMVHLSMWTSDGEIPWFISSGCAFEAGNVFSWEWTLLHRFFKLGSQWIHMAFIGMPSPTVYFKLIGTIFPWPSHLLSKLINFYLRIHVFADD